MNKVLLYYGTDIENAPIFNSNIKLNKWQEILEHVKKNGKLLYNSKKVYYYKLNNIDTIETSSSHENNRVMCNQYNFKLHKINNNYLKLDYIEIVVDYITPEFDYFNNQIHQLQVFAIDNIQISFDEYLEDGNVCYNIYLMVENENDMIKFTDIMKQFN